MTPRARLATGFALAVVLSVAGCVVDAIAAFGLTPTCQTGPAVPELLAVAGVVAMAAYVLPGAVIGWRRTGMSVAAGMLGAALPVLLLLWFATTPQTGFCF